MISISKLKEELNVEKLPKRWESIASSVTSDDYDFLERENLVLYNEKYNIFSEYFTVVLDAAEEIRKNKPLMDYVVLLKKSMEKREKIREEMIAELDFPKPKDGENPLGYDLSALLAILPHIPCVIEDFKRRNVPEDIIKACCDGFELDLKTNDEKLGRPVCDKENLLWRQFFLSKELLRIGRLDFHIFPEMYLAQFSVYRSNDGEYKFLAEKGEYNSQGRLKNRKDKEDEIYYTAELIETDDYYEGNKIDEKGMVLNEKLRLYKDNWTKICTPESQSVLVHIPAGSGFGIENVHKSYERAAEIFENSFPDVNFKGFYCLSWLMDTQLAEMLAPTSNIVRFLSDFMHGNTANVSTGHFESRINIDSVESIRAMPENTSLERAFKNHYLSGKYTFDQSGFIPLDVLKNKILK